MEENSGLTSEATQPAQPGPSMEGGAPRISARSTKGRAPSRYGFQPDDKGRKSGKTSTIKTTSSAAQRKLIEAEKKEKLAEVTRRLLEKQRDVEVAQLRHTSLDRRFKSVEERLSKDQQNMQLCKQYDDLQKSLMEAETELFTLQSELKYLQGMEGPEREVIESRAEANLENIDSDQEVSDSDSWDGKGKSNANVNDWVEQSQNQTGSTEDKDLQSDERPSDLDQCGDYHAPDQPNPTTSIPVASTGQHFGHGSRYHGPNLGTSYYRHPPPSQYQYAGPPPSHPQPIRGHHNPYQRASNNNWQQQQYPVNARSGSDMVNMGQLITALQSIAPQQQQSVIVRPPPSELPKFDGNPSDFNNFKAEYDRTSRHFSANENHSRLLKALKGRAKECVKHLMSCSSNLTKIWEILEKMYGRPELVLDFLVEKVKAARKVEEGKPETVVEFGIAVQSLVENCKNYQDDDFLHSRQLALDFVNKLPIHLRTQWYEWIQQDISRRPNLEHFSVWIGMKLDAAILAVRPPLDSKESEGDRKERRRRAPGAVNVSEGEQGEKPRSCVVCEEASHPLSTCSGFKKLTVDERWAVLKVNPFCIGCLRYGHKLKTCKKKEKCGSGGCDRFHHQLLHNNQKRTDKEKPPRASKDGKVASPPPRQEVVETEGSGEGAINLTLVEGCDGPLPILPIYIRGPSGVKKTYALLDTGASRSMISQDLATFVGITGKPTSYRYRAINGEIVTERKAEVVSFEVSSVRSESNFLPLNSAVTVSKLKFRPYSINVCEVKKLWPHLCKVKAKNLHQVIPEIIVGNDNPTLTLARQIVTGPEGTPVGWRSNLGWTISGSFCDSEDVGSINFSMGTDEILHELVKQSFSTEGFGVNLSSRKGINLEEQRAYRVLEANTKKVGSRWETGLLWREDKVNFPDSEGTAYRRLLSVERKCKDDTFRALYQQKIEELKTKGYVRKLTKEEADTRTPKTWYLPQFGVINPNKPGKIRLVLDAAAKVNSISLNAKLLKGPDLIRPLTAVLWNFRIHNIVINGDITDMFHRVFIEKTDCDSQRFLWRDGVATREPEHYRMVVMIFGAASSPSSAIYVKNRNAECYLKEYPEACRAIVDDFYVDDCLSGAATVEDAIQLRKEISLINLSGGFQVRKWTSNSAEVIASIPPEDRADGVVGLEQKADIPIERVLGLWWDPSEDQFTFRLSLHKVRKEILKEGVPTKRELCSLVMSIFDPLGFANYYKIKGMMLLQATWQSGISWDDELPMELLDRYRTWIADLHHLSELRIPRLYTDLLLEGKAELHTFVDASEEGFAAVCYLRVSCGEKVKVAFVSSKVRVAPMKKLTVPRLELQAAVLGSRLADTLKKELRVNFSRFVFWSDSKTVLLWIKSPAIKFKEFVANRIGEIQELNDPSEWRWIPTAENVADDATRFDTTAINSSHRWFRGPPFLMCDEADWPRESGDGVNAGAVSVENTEVRTENQHSRKDNLLPPVERFSSYLRLIRASAAVKKAAQLWLEKAKRTQSKVWNEIPITPLELQEAERKLLYAVQNESFTMELQSLSKGLPVKKGKISKLSPILRNGLICVKSRVLAADVIDEESKFPIILPSKHHFTELLILKEHMECFHQGKETVLNNLRKRFWILDGRSAVSRLVYNCRVCQVRKVKPIVPEMGNLPSYRLAAYQPPYTFTGLDYWGPMEVTVGRRHEKRWGAIFCCMVTRAVHLEVAHGLSTDEAIMTVSRFIDCRGRPKVIFSDNGTNFIGASNELKRQMKEVNFSEVACNGKFAEITWKFNPPGAPHFGSAWERLIRSVKKCIAAILHQKYPKDSTLLTTIKAVENIMNSRPLTQVSLDPMDYDAITPNHILRGSSDAGPGIPSVVEPSDEFLRSQWKRSQLFADQFWKRWINDFMPKLMLRGKWNHPCEPLRVGDLVFIVDENSPRNMWKRGFVCKVFPGKDGQVRVVDVKTTDGILKRPVSKVCPVGLRMDSQDELRPEGAGMLDNEENLRGENEEE